MSVETSRASWLERRRQPKHDSLTAGDSHSNRSLRIEAAPVRLGFLTQRAQASRRSFDQKATRSRKAADSDNTGFGHKLPVNARLAPIAGGWKLSAFSSRAPATLVTLRRRSAERSTHTPNERGQCRLASPPGLCAREQRDELSFALLPFDTPARAAKRARHREWLARTVTAAGAANRRQKSPRRGVTGHGRRL